jgi:hypothetical protein
MIDGDMDGYTTLLYQQNEELELMLQTQSDEIEKLNEKVKLLKQKLSIIKKSGDKMYLFMESMIEDSMFHDKTFDKANQVCGHWHETKQFVKRK